MNLNVELTGLNDWLENSAIIRRIERASFGVKEQQAFLEDISSLIDDGVTPNKAVETLSLVSKGTSIKVAKNILKTISEGKAMAKGMEGWFSPAVVELVKAGEQGGSLPQTMRAAAESLAQKSSALGSVVGSLSYPLVVLIVGFVITIYLNHSIIPQFEDIKPIDKWPASGQALVAFANFLQAWGWTLAVAATLIFIGIGKMLVSYIGELRQYIDQVPLLSVYRKLTAARFMETMGLLISNGVVFKRALGILHNNASAYLSWHLMLMERRLGSGRINIAEVLDTGMIDKFDVLRLKAIAEAHGFEHALVRQGKVASEKAVVIIRLTSKIVGGILLALGTAMAGFIITSIYAIGASLGQGLT